VGPTAFAVIDRDPTPAAVAATPLGAVMAELERDPEIIAWWATEAERVSALARLERDGGLDPSAMRAALQRLGALAGAWQEVQPVAVVRQAAIRLLRVRPLRNAGALQLAAAIVAAEDHPAGLALVTLDDRLAQAAEREGFPVIRPDQAPSMSSS
jgi:predicted nucleic acid-binding protein